MEAEQVADNSDHGCVGAAFSPTVRAIYDDVIKWRPGTILDAPQNFVPAFLSTVVWSLESQFP